MSHPWFKLRNFPILLAVALGSHFPAPMARGQLETPSLPDREAQGHHAQGRDARDTQGPGRELIARWVGDLSGDDYQLRRSAFMNLWAAGAAAEPVLDDLSRSRDRQLAETAAMLGLLIKLESTPQTRGEFAELIALGRFSTQRVLMYLCRQGHWGLAAELVASAGRSVLDAEGNSYLALAQIVDAACAQGDAMLAWPIVSACVEPRDRLWMEQRLGLEKPDDGDRDAQALRLFFAGQREQALALATTLDTRLQLVMWGADWKQLADENLRQLLLGIARDNPEDRAARMIFDRVAGEHQRADAALTRLRQELTAAGTAEPAEPAPAPVPAQPAPRGRLPNRQLAGDTEQPSSRLVMALMLAGEVDLFEPLMRGKGQEENLSYFALRSEYSRGLELFGLAPDGSNFNPWLPGAMGQMRSALRGSGLSSGLESFRQHTELANFLMSIGLTEEGQQLFEGLVLQATDSTYQVYCLRVLAFQARLSQSRPALLKLFARHSRSLQPESIQLTLASVYQDWYAVAHSLWSTAPQAAKDPTAAQDAGDPRWLTLETLWRLDRRELEAQFGPRELENWLMRALRDGMQRRDAQDEKFVEGPFVSQLTAVARDLGLPDLAMRIATTGGETIQPADVAELYQQQERLADAARYWKAARPGSSDRHDWLLKEIRANLLHGDEQLATQLEKSRWMRPLSIFSFDDWSSYASVAEKLQEQDRGEEAVLYGQAGFYLSELGTLDHWFAAHSLADVLRAQKRYAEAADTRLSANLSLLAQPLDRRRWLSYMLRVGQELHDRALAQLVDQDFDAALATLQVAERIKPFNIEIVEDVYPLLVAAGRQAAADQLLESYAQRMTAHLEKWPRDATSHNNLAWMYARCGKNLEAALRHAQTAVALAGESATYVDTLAEVEFLQGQVDSAIERARLCIRLDPRHQHYREQLLRFQTAQVRATLGSASNGAETGP
jgi:tetratricopeptide (TPR) repeat protein